MNTVDKKGFSLVEMFIALGLVSGLSLIMATMTRDVNKTVLKASYDSEKILVFNEIKEILKDPAKCLATFKTTSMPISVAGKFLTAGSSGAPINGYGNGKIEIESYTLSGSAPNGLLTISFKSKNILKKFTNKNQLLKIYYEGALNAVTKCYAVSTNSTELWGLDKATSNVFYQVGKVGIGTATPQAALDVSGAVKIGNESQVSLCNSALGGTIRYHSSGKIQYCKGSTSSWVALADSAPIHCIGTWGNCSATCGGGVQTYTVLQPADNGGNACPYPNGSTQPCNTQSCAPPVVCRYEQVCMPRDCGGYQIGASEMSPPPSCSFDVQYSGTRCWGSAGTTLQEVCR